MNFELYLYDDSFLAGINVLYLSAFYYLYMMTSTLLLTVLTYICIFALYFVC